MFGDGIDWDNEADRALREKELFFTYDPDIEIIRKYRATGKVLDCGCNVGRYVEVFRNAGYEYVGVDQSMHAIEIAMAHHPDDTFLVRFLWDMAFVDMFDIAFCNAVLQHNNLEEKKRIIPKIHQALKKDGVLLIRESTVKVATETQLTYEGWIALIESYRFTFLESWHKNELGIEDNYIFSKKDRVEKK